ncbi:hypothetical protein BASA81_006692 [Batrachochytrium salamandrivorans]|nr:hypothetical protein BASA81_006692 [Batrachochytrium salamandrivorans]
MADSSAYLPLLRMSIAMQDKPDLSTAHEMDPERAAWLKEAMANLLQNPVDELKQACERLKAAIKSENTEEEELVNTFEVILALVENIDLARDFHKLGGLQSTVDLLKGKGSCNSNKVLALACQTIGTVVHNHPETQTFANELDALTALCLVLSNKDGHDDMVQNKCLFALLGLIRHNDAALMRFIKEFKGISLLVMAMERAGSSAQTNRKALLLLVYVLQRVPALVCVLTAEHSFDVVAAALTKYAQEDVDCRQTAAQFFHLYRTVELSPALYQLRKTALQYTLPIAEQDQDELTVDICRELLL